MIQPKNGFAVTFVAIAALLIASASASASAPAPAWDVHTVPVPTNFVPGGSGQQLYETTAVNIGAATTDGSPITMTDTLPPGIDVKAVEIVVRNPFGGQVNIGPEACQIENSGAGTKVTCVISEALAFADEPARRISGEGFQMLTHVSVPAETTGSLTNRASIGGGGAGFQSAEVENEARPEPKKAGLVYLESMLTDEAGEVVTQAGAHPYQLTTSFAVNTEPAPPGGAPFRPAEGAVKDVRVALPQGLAGNATAASQCSAQDFNEPNVFNGPSGTYFRNQCPASSVVGFIVINQLEGSSQALAEAIYQLVPPPGMPARFGFQVAGVPFFVNTKLRAGSDYGVTAYLHNLAQVKRVTGSTVVFWGVPANSSHDPVRGNCLVEGLYANPMSLGSCASGDSEKALLTTPTSCLTPLETAFSISTWSNPNTFAGATSTAPRPTGCELLQFSPTFSVRPRTSVADSPTGLRVNLHVPQNDDPEALATPSLRDATVRLPAGIAINPASATGLQGCSPTQVGLTSAPGADSAAFSEEPADCPDASKVGSVEVDTPLLDHPIKGSVHVATQNENPFGSMIAIYATAFDEASGVVLKLAGRVSPDPTTGQLTTEFSNNPQLPFEDLTLDFFDGPRAPLRTPTTCGAYTTTTALKPWSAPLSGPDATPSDAFTVASAPGGRPCASSEAQQPHSPAFEAGTEVPLGSAYSPFVLRVGREDGSQQLRHLAVSMPPGLTGKLAGIPYCPEPQVAAAELNTGRAEQAVPSCPAGSRVGFATAAVGAGPQPYEAGGTAYLAGPYKGAPLSLVTVVPAVAGPLDLGTVVVRTALQVNPETAQITAVSDPLPTILAGIPLDLRRIQIDLDRPEFTLNPTNCDPFAIVGRIGSVTGAEAQVRSRFQVGGCKGLDFGPKLSLRLIGPTHRSAHPKLRAVLTARKGEANIGRATVTLPKTEFLENAHIRTICTRVQYAEEKCPAGSVYGYAKAWSPLLDRPVEGPVYLRSSSNTLPDLVASLDGQVHVDLVGRIDSVNQRIRNTFEQVPDVPVSKFVLTMQGGKKGLLVNNTELCQAKPRATAKFVGHNGKVHTFRPLARPTCGKKAKGARR